MCRFGKTRNRNRFSGELLRKLKKEPTDSAWLWALGRFGVRIPFYGSLACVVPAANGGGIDLRPLALR
jgi:hypothetical protein